MDLVVLIIGIVGIIATLAGSWFVGKGAYLRANLTMAEEIIGMLSVKINLLEAEKRELEERLHEQS